MKIPSTVNHGFIWYLFVRLDIQYWLTCIVCTKFRWQKKHLDQYAWKQVFLDQDHTKTVTIDGTTWESLILIPLHQWALMGLSRGDMSRLCDPREKKGWEMARPSAQCQCQAHNVVMSQSCISFTVHTKSGLIRFHTRADWWSCIVSWSVASSS